MQPPQELESSSSPRETNPVLQAFMHLSKEAKRQYPRGLRLLFDYLKIPTGDLEEQAQVFLRKAKENATSTFVDITRFNPDGTVVGTGVTFFSTNSTGQLAFLNNMVGIMQSEFSPDGGTIRTWEWKGGTLPFYNGAAPPTSGNRTTTIAPVR